MTKEEQIIKMSRIVCENTFFKPRGCENCGLYQECSYMVTMTKLYDEGYRIKSDNDKNLEKSLDNQTNNIEKICIDFVVDTLLNRPKDIESKIINYKEEDKKILINTINEYIKEINEQHLNISSIGYLGLINIYEGMLLLLENNKI